MSLSNEESSMKLDRDVEQDGAHPAGAMIAKSDVPEGEWDPNQDRRMLWRALSPDEVRGCSSSDGEKESTDADDVDACSLGLSSLFTRDGDPVADVYDGGCDDRWPWLLLQRRYNSNLAGAVSKLQDTSHAHPPRDGAVLSGSVGKLGWGAPSSMFSGELVDTKLDRNRSELQLLRPGVVTEHDDYAHYAQAREGTDRTKVNTDLESVRRALSDAQTVVHSVECKWSDTIDAVQAEKRILSEELRSLQSKSEIIVTAMVERNTKLNLQLHEKELTLNSAQNALHVGREQVSKLQVELHVEREQVSKLQMELHVEREQVSKLQMELHVELEQVKNLEGEKKVCLVTIEEGKLKLEAVLKTRDVVQAEKKVLSEELRSLEIKSQVIAAAMVAENKKLKLQLDEKEMTVDSTQNALHVEREQVNKLRMKVKNLEDETKVSQVTIEEGKLKLDSVLKTMDVVQAEKKILSEEIHSLESKSHAIVTAMVADNKKLKLQLDEKELTVDSSLNALRVEQEQVNKLRMEVKNLESEKKVTLATIAEGELKLEAALKDALAKIVQSDVALRYMVADKEKLKLQLDEKESVLDSSLNALRVEQEQVNKLRMEVKNLEGEKKVSLATIAEGELKLEAALAKREEADVAQRYMVAENQKLKLQLDEKELTLDSSLNALCVEQEQVNKLQMEVKNLEGEKNTSLATIAEGELKLQAALQDALAKREAADMAQRYMVAENMKLKLQLDEKELTLDSSRNALRVEQEQVNKLRMEVKNLEGEKKVSLATIAEGELKLEAGLQDALAKRAEADVAHRYMVAENQKLKLQLDEKELTLDSSLNALRVEQEQVNKLRKEVKNLEGEKNASLVTIAEGELKLQAALQDALAKREMADVAQRYMVAENKELKLQLDEKELTLDSTQNALHAEREQINKLQMEVKNLEGERKASLATIAEGNLKLEIALAKRKMADVAQRKMEVAEQKEKDVKERHALAEREKLEKRVEFFTDVNKNQKRVISKLLQTRKVRVEQVTSELKGKFHIEKEQVTNELKRKFKIELEEKNSLVENEKKILEGQVDKLECLVDIVSNKKRKLEDDFCSIREKNDHLENSQDAVQKVLAEEQEKKLCHLCIEKPKDTMCFPCLHLHFCLNCLKEHRKRSNTCPTCRTVIAGVLDGVFLV